MPSYFCIMCNELVSLKENVDPATFKCANCRDKVMPERRHDPDRRGNRRRMPGRRKSDR